MFKTAQIRPRPSLVILSCPVIPGQAGQAGITRDRPGQQCTARLFPGRSPAVVQVTAAITWTQSAERGVWVAEGPGGQARWRGQPCRTRLAAQMSAERGAAS